MSIDLSINATAQGTIVDEAVGNFRDVIPKGLVVIANSEIIGVTINSFFLS